MTNTISTIFATATSGLSSAVDGWIAIGVTITVGLVGFALFNKFAPKKKKVV